MSSEDPQHETAPGERREAVREKAQLVQTKQSRARRIRGGSIAVAVIAVVAVAGIAISWTIGSSASKPLLHPANVEDDGIIVTQVMGASLDEEAGEVGSADVLSTTVTPAPEPAPEPTPDATPDPTTTAPAVDIRIYVDYLSPGSKQFQTANAPQLSTWVTQGAATLTYHPVAMLTAKSSGTKYSLRAASAAACVANHSPDSFFAFTNALLEQQPELDAAGFSNEELADIALGAGSTLPKIVRACIEDESFASWAKSATERALKAIPGTDGVALTGAPMVLVNGTLYVGALDDPAEFSQFVLTIASDDYYKTASPTPTPTP